MPHPVSARPRRPPRAGRGRRTARAVGTVVALMAVTACSGGTSGGGEDDTAPASTTPSSSETSIGSDTTTPAPTPPATTPPATAPTATSPPDTVAATTVPNGTEPPEFDASEITAIVEAFLADEALDGAGLAIVHRERGLVHHAAFGEFDLDRVSLVASSSKMVTAGVLARLADDGLLDLDVPIARQFGDVAEWTTAHPDITPAQLVSNSSGLPGLAEGLALGDYLCQYQAAGTVQDCAAQIFTTPADDAAVIAPDTEYRYGGAQWQVAGAIAELAAGRSWSELVDEIYVQPCGLDTFGFTNHWTALEPGGFEYPTAFDGDVAALPDTDNPNLEGGLFTTVDDFAKVVLMHVNGGTCGDEQVLTPGALATLHADRTGEVYGSDVGYGMGWFVDRDTGRLTDPGAYGSVAWLDLGAGHGGFLVVEADGGTGSRLAAQLYDPVAAALARS